MWDVASGERLGGVDASEGPSRQVAWSPLSPGVFLSAQPSCVALAAFTGTASALEATTDHSTGQQARRAGAAHTRAALRRARVHCNNAS